MYQLCAITPKKEESMKRLISVFIVIGSVLICLGCQDSVTDTNANQSDKEFSLLLEQESPSLVNSKTAPSLKCTIEYEYVGHLGIPDDNEGRRIVWEGEIHGDIEGTMKWWFVRGGGPPNMPDEAHSSFYEARWEIWSGSDLLLAGESAGQTATPADKDGIWNGHGMVTETNAIYEPWNGRRIKEGGNVNFTFPFSGEGTFRIN